VVAVGVRRECAKTDRRVDLVRPFLCLLYDDGAREIRPVGLSAGGGRVQMKAARGRGPRGPRLTPDRTQLIIGKRQTIVWRTRERTYVRLQTISFRGGINLINRK